MYVLSPHLSRHKEPHKTLTLGFRPGAAGSAKRPLLPRPAKHGYVSRGSPKACCPGRAPTQRGHTPVPRQTA